MVGLEMKRTIANTSHIKHSLGRDTLDIFNRSHLYTDMLTAVSQYMPNSMPISHKNSEGFVGICEREKSRGM